MSDQPKHIDARGANIGVIGDHATIHHHYSHTTQGIPLQRPPKAEHFKGRDEVLNELLPLLQPGKAVTLCGPGGMGKTALAAQAAWTLAPGKDVPDRFPDGIIFYSFYGKHSVEEAITHIVRSYDEAQQDTSFAAASRLLANKQALLILDGTEEADNLKAVLDLRGTCGVLITSRKRSDAQADRLDLKPLDEQPAAEVFRLYSGVAADDAGVQGICKLLGGWPVALRIAGRYLSTTGESAADYLQWLEQEPFKELAGGQHQEENAALLLRRSVDAVSADARLALGLAGCLAFAPIAREPVAAILDSDERRARAALNELVNYGLLEKREERWQISHALVHTYARSELVLSRERLAWLAIYYIDFCRTQSEAGLTGYACLDKERAHCLRLIESCLASGLWQRVQGLVRAVDIYLERQGWWTEELAALSMRLIAAQQAGDHKDEGECLNDLGYTCEKRGEREQALCWYEQSLLIHQQLGDRKEKGTTLNNMAMIYWQQGKHELALQQYEQSLSIAREISDRTGEGMTLNNIGRLYYDQKDYEQALQYFEQSLPVSLEVGDKIGEGATLNNIATIYRAHGNPAKALEYHEQALAIARELGDRAGEANRCWNFGLTYEDMGELAKAEEYIARAGQIAKDIGHPSLEKYRKGLARVRAARQG
ncbi:tetratricopeptide repeat protein [Candidatus Electronema sp. PJ]|uniref:tetratricopeptide repeat protein n=1 Tax=Candidatus Electronema sp. PJ TaxID=3401572 RepID=UPI003AA7E41C